MAVWAPETPTLFWRRLEQLGSASWAAFQIHLPRAALRAAEELDEPKLAKVSASNPSFRRWASGISEPRDDAARVIVHWLGHPIEALMAPATGLTAARTLPDDVLAHAQRAGRRWPTSTLIPAEAVPGFGGHWRLDGIAAYDSTTTVAQVYEATRQGDLLVIDPADHDHVRQLADASARMLLLAAYDGELYLLDAAHARRHLARRPFAVLPVPRANRLDDLTYALTLALLTCDDALLADDWAIEEQQEALERYRSLPRSAPARTSMPDLRAVTSAFIGSEFCARHILGHLADTESVPLFWTREQRGEQGIGWLMWRHKHVYLRELTGRFGTGGRKRMARAFCIPASAVSSSDPYERILLFLTVALMELHGLDVWVSADERLADVDGFVLVPGEHAVLANWVAGEAMWRVDATAEPADLLSYQHMLDHARATSVVRGEEPRQRLRALAEHLALDWAWLTARCGELARSGSTAMLRPRSRHLTLAEVDRVLAFVGTLG
ncbi:hypothetical protein [Kitasatospora sp. MBT63]|uniref:hypothetical protein n=1 Tax=Kitasatospora sp. MBT63 TaxID=1444768 RepID=UPI00053B90C3|nr:hypothetical protein [Kitasatospora sp. MBT63]